MSDPIMPTPAPLIDEQYEELARATGIEPAHLEPKKALEAVVWVSEGRQRHMRVVDWADPDEVTEGEIVDE